MKIIIIGFGVVGRGVAEVMLEKAGHLRKTKDINLKVVAVCEINGSIVSDKGIDLKSVLKLKDLSKHRNWSKKKSLQVIDGVEADLVLELTPGDVKDGEPGLSHIKAALKKKINVVTSNKAPIALHYSELIALAEKNKVELSFEASVGGAIPIINLRKKCLQINEIKSVYGVLNGTTNYVLSKMAEEGVGLDDALLEAKELGIAESDPSYDINGIDTGLKVAILANALLNRKVSFRDVSIQGVREITPESVELAKKHGFVIKLIGDVSRLEVSPRLVPLNHSLNVSGSLNAVLIDSDVAGELVVVGYGAGARETASSIFSDIIDVASR